MRDAVIVSAVRTAVGKAPKGTLRATRPDDLAAVAIQGAMARVPGLDKKEVDDVIIGCAMPEGEQGMNVARIGALRAGMPIESSAMTINRYCASGLQSIALYRAAILRAKTIIWNGPPGVFEFEKFSGATKAMAEAIAEATKRGATTVVGGGDTATAAKKFKIADKVTHCSTGGGASLEFLEGKVLPGVAFLEG